MGFILTIFAILIFLFLLVCFIDFKIKESDKKTNDEREQKRKLKYYNENKVSDNDLVVKIKNINDKQENAKFFIQLNDNVLRLVSYNIWNSKARILEYNVSDIKNLSKIGDDNYVCKKAEEVHYTTTLKYCGGNSNVGTDCECVININNNIVNIAFQKHTKITVPEIIDREYVYSKNIIDVGIKTEQQISKDVTLGRLFIFGILAFGMKKEKLNNRYYIVIKYVLNDEDKPVHLILYCDNTQQELTRLRNNIDISKRYKKYEDERKCILEIGNDKIELSYDSYKVIKKLLPDLTVDKNIVLSSIVKSI